jgi:hypothetical protein
VYCTDSDRDDSRVPLELRMLRSPFPGGGAGLGATSPSTEITEGTTAVGAGITAAGLIGAGAAAGSVVPVLGTAIGALVGLGIAIFGGNKEAGGINNPVYRATAQKWYNWFFPQWASMNPGNNSAAALESGYEWWAGQMQANGVANAWKNFSTSAQPVAAGVSATAQVYQNLGYGAPTDPPPVGTNPLVAPPTNVPYSQLVTMAGAPQSPSQVAAGYVLPGTPAPAAPATAALLGGISTPVLLVGAALGLALLFSRRAPARSSEA